jgi:hypothetical protein
MFGVCLGGSAGAYQGGSGSACFVVDEEGVGLVESLGLHEGVTAGWFLAPGLTFSPDGDIEDQRNGFDYESGYLGVGGAGDVTFSHGTSGQTGKGVHTVTALAGEGLGFGAVHGTSNTWAQRIEYKQIAAWFGIDTSDTVTGVWQPM